MTTTKIVSPTTETTKNTSTINEQPFTGDSVIETMMLANGPQFQSIQIASVISPPKLTIKTVTNNTNTNVGKDNNNENPNTDNNMSSSSSPTKGTVFLVNIYDTIP